MRRIGGLGTQFGGVPPRPFVRGERAGFHELSIVVRLSARRSAGRRVTTGAAAVSRSPRDPPSIIGTIARVSGRIETKSEHDWLVLTPEELSVGAAYDWAIRPDCGAVVVFSGTVRDHAEGRDGVDHLTYEAYEDKVLARFAEICAETRRRWPDTGRIVMWHRTGRLVVGESSVVTVVSAPHRAEAFEAARFCIDTLKASVPIWKREIWAGGESWGLEAQHIVDAGAG